MFGFPFDSQITGTDEAGLPIYDRASNSEQLATLIRSFFTNGIFGTGGFDLTHNGGLQYTVSVGKALVQGRYWNMPEEQTITLAGGGSVGRIDTIVIRMDLSLAVRGFVLDVVQGTPAASPSAPDLTRNDIMWELGLYNIPVGAGETAVNIARIVDTRLDSSRCGYVVEAMEGFDTSTFYNQIQADLNQFKTQNEQEFNDWFSGIQTVLDGDVAGNLLNKINTKISGHTATATLVAADWQTDGEYMWLNNVYVPGVTDSNVVIVTPDGGSHTEYASCGIRAVGQGIDFLNFNADAIPEFDLNVNVLVLDLGVNA